VQLTILSPEDARALVPELANSRNPLVWVYRFTDHLNRWTLSVATHAPPGSAKLSLGGFRIVPEDRLVPGFSTDVEAIALAMGMEEKVHWSRVIGVGGPLVMHDIHRIVGGKCVLAPTPDARIGQPNDTELLDFAIECFKRVERVGGFLLTTGQDLGHGLMSDGTTQSLQYLNARYKGSAIADTSDLTAYGNFQILCGMLRACEVDLADATVGLIGGGNIGKHVVEELLPLGTRMFVLEAREERRAMFDALNIDAWPAETKQEFLQEPMDALVVNASGGSLDEATVRACARNDQLQVICGCENLVMPDSSLVNVLRDAHKVYAPTELGGMMGYLTAAEEYLSRLEGVSLDRQSLVAAARRLDEAGYEATRRIRDGGHRETFEEAVTAIYGAANAP
jgi:hypothetical protein